MQKYDKEIIKRITPDELARHGVIQLVPGKTDEYICLFCGNGEGVNHTGIKPEITDHVGWYCFKCGKSFDNIHILEKHYNLNSKTDFREICRRAYEDFNLTSKLNYNTTAQKNHSENLPSTVDNSKELELIHADILAAQEFLEQLHKKSLEQSETLNFRGLTYDTLKNFGCGYLPEWISPKIRLEFEQGKRDKLPPTSRRLIVPTPNHYNAVLPELDRTEKNKKWWKMHAGSKEIFGADFLPLNPAEIIIVEGEIDAMSIWQATQGKYNVIAIGGAAEYRKAVKFLQDKFSDHKPKILILLDSDDAGRLNAPNLREELLKIGFPAVCKFLSDDNSKLDANDILQKQGDEKLAEIISSIVADAQNDFSVAEKEIAEISNFNKKADEWKKYHGEIDPATLEELRNAEKYFDSLSAADITTEIIFNSKRKIALCKVYDFCQSSATAFIAKIEKAITVADEKTRAARKDNSLPPVSADIETLKQVSIRDLKDDIDKLETQVRKERKSFLQKHNAEISKQKHEKYLAKQREEKKAREEKIRQLQQGPLSDEAVAEIIENIRENLDWLVDKHGERVRVKATAMNFKEIFCNDPNIRDLFAYDEFQQAIVFSKKPTWKKDNSCVGEMWQDVDDSELRIYLRETYQELAHEQMTYDYLTSYANKKSFHVVKDYFTNLPEWDGKHRAEEIFIKFLRVDDTPYTREITKKFLLAAMARIYHPGCNFQSALVLQGAQSIGKSYVIERLGGKWHTTLSDNVDDPHAIDALQNSWFVEMKEMSAARKADVNAMKSFIERSADNRRAAYERRAKISKRHCVFAITVNDENFLRDQTGNRRFWILKCKSKMFEIVEGLTDEYIQQLWAEIKQKYFKLFADGFDDKKLQLSFETKRRAEEIADQFMQDDGMKGEIEAFLQMKIPYKAIWELLTKEQRRKFFVDGSITLLECDLMALHEANRKISDEKEFYDALDLITNQKKGGIMLDPKDGLAYYKIYGVEVRQSICAAEILNECFGNGDRRKSSQKINELLPKIEGWQVGERNKHYSGYGDQKKIFYRIAADENEKVDRQDFEPDNLNDDETPSSFEDNSQNDSDYTFEENDFDDDDFPI